MKRRTMPKGDAPFFAFILATLKEKDWWFKQIKLNICLYLSYENQQSLEITEDKSVRIFSKLLVKFMIDMQFWRMNL